MTVKCQTITYEQDGNVYEGFLAIPATPPVAVIAIAHAWGGLSGFEQDRARQLAEWGYAAFAMDVYGKGRRGQSTQECQALMEPLINDRVALQSRLAHGLSVAKTQSGTDTAAAIGFCFGGLSVLDMARTNMALAGVASFHGLLGAPENTARAIQSKILLLHGWDDPMATPDDVCAFAREMDGAKADWQIHAYGGTKHAFTNPQANDPEMGTVYDGVAERRSFAALKTFLHDLFH